MNFDMNTTWSQALGLVRSNFQLLAIVAGVFLLLPAVLIYVAVPDIMSLTALASNPEALTSDPEALTAMMQGMIGPLVLYGIIGFLAQIIGYVGMQSLMGNDRPTVGQAILLGLKAIPTLFGALILFMLGYLVFTLIFGVIIAALIFVAGDVFGAILAFVMVLGLFLVILYVMTRLSLVVPILVSEREMNPITLFKRSWELTAPRAKAIFGFFVLLFLAYMVVSMVVGGVLGLIIAMAGSGLGGSSLLLGLANGIIGAIVAMVMCGILMSMYQQLSGTDAGPISDTFD